MHDDEDLDVPRVDARSGTGPTALRIAGVTRDVVDLLARYGVVQGDDPAEFLALARRADEPGWWQRNHDLLPGWAETCIGLEQAASLIRSYQVQQLTSAPSLDKRADVEQYAQVMDRLCAQFEPLDRTAAVLGKIRAEL
ncbi:hypothetical protein ACVGOW_15145 [Pseudonocardia saturnea]